MHGPSASSTISPALGRMSQGEETAAVPARELPAWIRALLAFPLAGKLAGANALIVVATLATAIAMHGSGARDIELVTVVALALALSFAVNLALVMIALRPLRALEATAEHVRRGDLSARVPPSMLADRDLRRLGDALNVVLDHLVADRTRLLRLASEVIRVGDRERATLARELHDSTAQTLSAVVMQLAAATREIQQPDLAARLEAARAATLGALEEVRLLAHTVHPRVLDDLGLPAALRYLAREMSERSEVVIEVQAPPTPIVLVAERASVLYRVAQEAVGNALAHGSPTKILLRLKIDGKTIVLEIFDDGRGFDPSIAAQTDCGLGIFSMRERVALVNGSFHVDSHPGRGTMITATIPF